MAQATAVKTYDVSTNVRDVTDLISVVANTETPFYTGIGKTKASNKNHESQYYALTTGSANALIEGQDYSPVLLGVPSTVSNYTQIFGKIAKVSKTQQAVTMYGVDDLLAQEIEWRMKEIATDVEKALLQGTGNSGASGTARLLTGALSLVTSNIKTGTGTGDALTETYFNDALETIWAAGGRPKNVLVNSYQKRKISAFSGSSNTKQVMFEKKELVNTVDTYISDFGILEIGLDAFMAVDKVLIYDKNLFKVAMLRPFTVEDYPSQGSYVAKTIEGELTLESNNEKGSGVISSIKSA